MPPCFRLLRGLRVRRSFEAGGIRGMSVQIISKPLPLRRSTVSRTRRKAMISRPRSPKAAAPSNADLQRYRAGLGLLDKIRRQGQGPEEWVQFVALILHACKKAICWKADLSYSVSERADFHDFYEDLRSAINGLEKLRKFAHRQKSKFDIIASRAENEIGLTCGILIESGLGRMDGGLTRRLLQALMDDLIAREPKSDSDTWSDGTVTTLSKCCRLPDRCAFRRSSNVASCRI